MCDHVWIFEARTLSTASPTTMRDVWLSGPDGTKVPRTGHPDPWRARSGETLRACPVPRLGVALVLARPAVANWWISNREGSVSGGYSDHPLIRLACDRWQRREPAAEHPTRLIDAPSAHAISQALEYRAPSIRLPFAAPTSQCFSIPPGREQGAGLAPLARPARLSVLASKIQTWSHMASASRARRDCSETFRIVVVRCSSDNSHKLVTVISWPGGIPGSHLHVSRAWANGSSHACRAAVAGG
jgi:hypothetical protein